MNVKEFKKYLETFSDIIDIKTVMSHFLMYEATDLEVDYISKYALGIACQRMREYEIENKELSQQLIQTKMYLKGEMYKDEKTAKEMLNKQIENIEEVLKK